MKKIMVEYLLWNNISFHLIYIRPRRASSRASKNRSQSENSNIKITTQFNKWVMEKINFVSGCPKKNFFKRLQNKMSKNHATQKKKKKIVKVLFVKHKFDQKIVKHWNFRQKIMLKTQILSNNQCIKCKFCWKIP